MEALEWLFPRMNSSMSNQILFFPKTRATIITLKRFYVRMNFFMTYQLGISFKRGVTLLAFIWFFSGVKFFVWRRICIFAGFTIEALKRYYLHTSEFESARVSFLREYGITLLTLKTLKCFFVRRKFSKLSQIGLAIRTSK